MKHLSAKTALLLLLSLSGCYVAGPAPYYAPPPAAYYGAPGYYAAPAYAPGYYAPYASFGIGVGGGWRHH